MGGGEHVLIWANWTCLFKSNRGESSPLANLNKFSLPNQNMSLFWCHALSCRPEEFLTSSFLFRKMLPHQNFWFQKLAQLIGQAFKHLIQRTRLTNIYRLVWSDITATAFPVTLPNTFPHKIQTHSLLHAQHHFQSINYNRPSLPPKNYTS